MKTKILTGLAVLIVGLLGWTIHHAASAGRDPAAKAYNESADGARQVEAAVQEAQSGNKRVLIQFGANWCAWCLRLHGLCSSDRSLRQELEGHYSVVLIDVSNGHNRDILAKFAPRGSALGLPFLAVLDAEGALLRSQSPAEFVEGGGYNAGRMLAFLKSNR
jgi:thiol:disulfide interchange protein